MSNDDDENSKAGESSPPSHGPASHRTMMGMSFDLPTDARASGEEPAVEAASADLGGTATDGDDDDFIDDPTQIGGALIDDEGDVAVHNAVDEAWDELFPAESTGSGLVEATAPTIDEPEHAALLAADATESIAEDDEPLWDDGIDSLSLAEDSLPEPIRDPTPTLDDAEELKAVSGSFTYVGDNAVLADFEAGQTEMLDSPFQSDPTVAKLVALDGPASGQEFFASGLRNTVGRGTHNGIVVPDVAMSRQHFEIVRNPDDSYSLVDLQSINGTTLNGTKVREADLFHGDRVEAGKSSFQFVLTGNIAPPSRQRRLVPAATATMGGQPMPSPSPAAVAAPQSVNRLMLAVTIVTIGICIVLAITVGLLVTRAPVATSTGPDAASVYLLGVEAVKSRDWERAQSEFERARLLDPSLTGVDDQLGRIASERSAQADLEQAKALVEAEKLPEAISVLDGIPEDSVYFADADELRRDARKSDVLGQYEDAQAALAAGDIARATELVDAILQRIPAHRGALALRDRIAALSSAEPDAGSADDDSPTEPKPKRDDGWVDLVGSKSVKLNPNGPKKNFSVPNLTQGFLLYRTRKFAEAEKFFADAAATPGPAASRMKTIAGAVVKFRAEYPPGIKDFEAGRWAEAAKKLTAAKQADGVVGDYFAQELNGKLATANANLGLQSLSRGDGKGARRLLDTAMAHDSGDPTAKQLRSDIKRVAQKHLDEAKALKASNPKKAASLCKSIEAMLSPDDALYKNASQLLKSLPAP